MSFFSRRRKARNLLELLGDDDDDNAYEKMNGTERAEEQEEEERGIEDNEKFKVSSNGCSHFRELSSDQQLTALPPLHHTTFRLFRVEDPDEHSASSTSSHPLINFCIGGGRMSAAQALQKCTNSLSEIHRLLRESSTSSYGSMSKSPSVESSPIEQATSRSARRKWHSAMRVIQGLNRFKTPVSHKRTTEIRDQSIGRTSEPPVIDPVYLALKQATGRYSRRGSNFDSATPSPRNLSQVSLQDSGYVEIGASKANPLLGSTPQLDNAGRSVGRRRAPKLSQQMKSLSLDCQDMPPRINNASTRSPLITGSKLAPKEYRGVGKASGVRGSSDFSDAERSCSPIVKSRRSSSTALHSGGYIVTHEFSPSQGTILSLGERVNVVDNGDPDWLHGYRCSDRTEHLFSFPATCVAQILPGEQAMRVLQNLLVASDERKLRLYRDQIIFVQPDSLHDGKVTIRTEHNAYVPCPLSSLAMI